MGMRSIFNSSRRCINPYRKIYRMENLMLLVLGIIVIIVVSAVVMWIEHKAGNF